PGSKRIKSPRLAIERTGLGRIRGLQRFRLRSIAPGHGAERRGPLVRIGSLDRSESLANVSGIERDERIHPILGASDGLGLHFLYGPLVALLRTGPARAKRCDGGYHAEDGKESSNNAPQISPHFRQFSAPKRCDLVAIRNGRRHLFSKSCGKFYPCCVAIRFLFAFSHLNHHLVPLVPVSLPVKTAHASADFEFAKFAILRNAAEPAAAWRWRIQPRAPRTE